MKQFFLMAGLLTCLITSIQQTFAGGEKGNGGYSIVCRDNEGPITSAELLDIYEGRLLYKKNYAVDLNSVADLVNLAQERVKKYVLFASKLSKEIELIEKNMVMIPEGHELEATDDAFPVIKKKGCKFEQLASYTLTGEVLISEEIIHHIDNINKAALIVHEAIYSIRRKALGETTSQNTRRLVAQLLSTNPDVALIEKMALDSLQAPNQRKRPCGTQGTVEERIESCSYQERQKFNMVLVTRTVELKEIWLDVINNILWSDRLPSTMSHSLAVRACEKVREEMGHMEEFKWRLPTGQEFSSSSGSILGALPNMENYWFWSSSTRGRMVMVFNTHDGSTAYSPFVNNGSGSVRCVTPIELNF